MTFIQSCYIAKNTPRLRKKLEKLGYQYGGGDSKSWGTGALYCFNNKYYEIYKSKPARYHSIIDCGTNEELFIAIAALRDDSDYMQWFICGDKEFMFQVDKPNMNMKEFIHNYMDGWNTDGARKATVKELIELF